MQALKRKEDLKKNFKRKNTSITPKNNKFIPFRSLNIEINKEWQQIYEEELGGGDKRE